MIVNGEPVENFVGRSLLELIEKFGLDPALVAVERNGEIPDRNDWKTIRLEESDRIELIRFVGGG